MEKQFSESAPPEQLEKFIQIFIDFLWKKNIDIALYLVFTPWKIIFIWIFFERKLSLLLVPGAPQKVKLNLLEKKTCNVSTWFAPHKDRCDIFLFHFSLLCLVWSPWKLIWSSPKESYQGFSSINIILIYEEIVLLSVLPKIDLLWKQKAL